MLNITATSAPLPQSVTARSFQACVPRITADVQHARNIAGNEVNTMLLSSFRRLTRLQVSRFSANLCAVLKPHALKMAVFLNGQHTSSVPRCHHGDENQFFITASFAQQQQAQSSPRQEQKKI